MKRLVRIWKRLDATDESINDCAQRLLKCRAFTDSIKVSSAEHHSATNHYRRKNALLNQCRNELTWALDQLVVRNEQVGSTMLLGFMRVWPLAKLGVGPSYSENELNHLYVGGFWE